MDPLKRILQVSTMAGLGIMTSGCSHHMAKQSSQVPTPTPQLQQIYHAPVQQFDLDLSAAVFRGRVKVTEHCSALGTGTDIVDYFGRFFRIDAVNILHHSGIEVPDGADDKMAQQAVLNYYLQSVNTGGTVVEQTAVNTAVGPAYYALQSRAGADGHTYGFGYLILKRGNMAYVLQHMQRSVRSTDMKNALKGLLMALQIPGTPVKSLGLKQPDQVAFPDLQATSPQQQADWARVHQCH